MTWTPETEALIPKPWSKEECRDRYVRGEKIGLRSLEELSGRGLSTLGEWSGTDDWVVQRERFWDERRTKTDQLIIEKSAEAISDELAAIATGHYETYKTVCERAEALLESAAEADEVNFLSLAIHRSIQGQRVALGMKFQDLNEAIAAIERAGFKVIDGETYTRLLAAQDGGEDYSSDDFDPSELVEVGVTSEAIQCP
jgi:hypothetical protein